MIGFVVIALAQAAAHTATPAAMQLAALLDPEPMLAAANVRLHLRRLEAVAEQDPNLRQFKTADPTGYAQLVAACEQAVQTDVAKFYPSLQGANADTYARNLTADDFQVLLAYYRSPLGIKVVAAGFAAMNGATEADRAAARSTAMASLSAAERNQVAALAAKTAAQHLHLAYEERQQNGRMWALKSAPVINADVAAAMMRVVSQSAGAAAGTTP